MNTTQGFDSVLPHSRAGPKARARIRGRARGEAARVGAKTAPEGADVFVDGERVPETAPLHDAVDVAPGEHEFTARLGTRTSTREHIRASAGQTVKVALRIERERAPDAIVSPPSEAPRSESGTGRWLVSGGLGVVGLTGVAIGIGFGAASSKSTDDALAVQQRTPGNVCADPGSSACREWQGHLATARDQRTIQWAGIVGGSAFIIGGIVTYLVWPKPRTEKRSAAHWVVPIVSSEQMGLATGGSF